MFIAIFSSSDGPLLCGNLNADTIEAFFKAVGGPSVSSFAKLVSTATVPHLASDPLHVQLSVERAAWSHALSDRVDTRLADHVAFRLYCVFNRMCNHRVLPMTVDAAACESVCRRLGLPLVGDDDVADCGRMRRVRLRFPSGCSTCSSCSNLSDVSLNSSHSASSASMCSECSIASNDMRPSNNRTSSFNGTDNSSPASNGIELHAFLGHASRHAHNLDETALNELYCDLVREVVLEGDVRVTGKTQHVVVRHGWLLVMDSKDKDRVVQRVSLVDAATRLIPSNSSNASDKEGHVALEVFRRQRAVFRLAELGFDSVAEAMVWQCAVHEGIFHASSIKSNIGRRAEE